MSPTQAIEQPTKKRKQPKWMEPLSHPNLMPNDLQERTDFTQDEKMEIWRKHLYAKAVQHGARARMFQLSAQKRADEDHRKIVLGGAVEAEIAELIKQAEDRVGELNEGEIAKESAQASPQLPTLIADLLNRRVRDSEQFLFPKLFPTATRPERGPKSKKESVTPPTAGEKVEDEK